MTATTLATQESRRIVVITRDSEASSALESEFKSLAVLSVLPDMEALPEAALSLAPHLLITTLRVFYSLLGPKIETFLQA